MSTDITDSIAAVADISFEATTSKTIDETEKYHAKVMRDVILGELENKLREAIASRRNSIYYFLDKQYDYKKPKPHMASNALSQGLKAIQDLPWVAHAKFYFELHNPSLKICIQDPETKKQLFPSDSLSDSFERQYYAGERPKEPEQSTAQQALPPPKVSVFDNILIALRLKKPEKQAALPPPSSNGKILPAPEEPEKTANQKLSEEFANKAREIKNYGLQIPGLNIDFKPLDTAIAKIDALLNTDWDEDVIGASRGSYRSALSDLNFLKDSFKEHTQILSVINQDQTTQTNTLPEDTLNGLRQNFDNVTKSVENAARRGVNSRLDRAAIGVEVHDTRLQLHKLKDIELVPVNTQPLTIDR